jgi:type I restriction enzyme, S subunit
MSECSIINFSALGETLDFDAEHYHPKRLRAMRLLANGEHCYLSDYAFQRLELRVSGKIGNCFDTSAAIGNFLSSDGGDNFASTKKSAYSGDVIISKLRSYLQQVCVIPKRSAGFSPDLSTEFVVLATRTQETIDWLLPFLLSEPVQTVLHWAQTGSNHPRFDRKTLFALPVSSRIEKLIPQLNKLVQQAVSQFENARDLYPKAEAELLDQLGWAKLEKQPHELTYNANFSTLTSAGRSDAEFFSPQIRRIHAMLAKQKQAIKDVANLREEPFTPHRSQNFHYIEIGDIASNTTITGTELLGDNAPSRAQNFVRANDVITSTVRPIRRLSGMVAPDQDGWVCSSGFAVLKPQTVPPEYLVVYLRLAPVCELMNAYAMASMYPTITADDLLKIPFFLPEKKLVDRICVAVTTVRAARYEAEAKLAEAKRLVEEAIQK